MSMHVNLSPEMEGFIKTKVSSGFYGNATEVIRDALRRMQAEEQRTVAWQSAVAAGSAQLDRGEGVDYTPASLDDITQAARAEMHSGKPINSDVLPERSIRLSLKARQDFIDILRYTGERWGEAQLAVYRGKLDAALQLIGRNPAIGHHDDALPMACRLFVVGSHVIVYRDDTTSIGIFRILHQRMHLPRQVLKTKHPD